VAVLADTLLEQALDETATTATDDTAIARAGAAFVSQVSLKTTVLLLRIRHQLTVMHGSNTRLLMCELDEYFARLYGLTRDELRYILDPTDVMGPDYPSETFRVLKESERQ